PLFEKPPRWPLRGEVDGPLVSLAGIRMAAEAPAEVGASRVRKLVAVEFVPEPAQRRETSLWTVAHRYRHRAIQLDDGRGREGEQDVVQPDDLAPVGVFRRLGLRVYGCDGCLDGVRAGS